MSRLVKAMALVAALGFSDVVYAQTVIQVAVTPTPGTTDQVPAAGTSYFVDLMNAVAEQSGLQVEFIPLLFADLLPATIDGRVDVAASNFTITAERRAMGLEFTTPVISWQDGLIVAASDATPYVAVSEFAGHPVGTTAGATPYENLIRNAGLEVRTYPTQLALAAAVASGEVKAGIINSASGGYLLNVQNPNPGVRIVDTYVGVLPSVGGLPVRQADTDLLNQLNAALAALRENGTLATLNGTYFFGLPSP